MSFSLWTTDRTFPLCPISDMIPLFPVELGSVPIISLVILLIVGMFSPNRVLFIAIILFLLLLFLQDQIRWQPWAYLYFFLLIPFVFNYNDARINSYFQLLIIGVYFWAGLHKYNADFIDHVFNDILKELFGIKDETTMLSLRWLGYLIPTIEIMIALMLVFPKTRIIGIIGATISHVFILIYLIKIDYNSIVYPWNIAMIFFVFISFFRNPNSLNVWRNNNWQVKFLNSSAILFFILMPSLCLFNLWDNYLSFKLYSGKTNSYYISIADDEVNKLDQRLHHYFWNIEGLTGGEIINVNHWALKELNVPFYPETRVFKQVARSFCPLGIDNDKLISVEFEGGFGGKHFQEYKCSDF